MTTASAVRATTFVWMTPAAILLIGLFLIPTIYAIYLGFTNLQLLGPHAQNYSFTGLANFNRLVNDPVFWYSVKLTLIFVIVSGIIAQTLLGLGLALLGQRAHFTVRASVGSVVILAWVLPEIAVAFIWYSFGQAGGLLSEIVGRPSDDLLASLPLLIVCVANTWRGTAFSMLILSAGLRNVPQEVDEAAQLEGAGYWRRLVPRDAADHAPHHHGQHAPHHDRDDLGLHSHLCHDAGRPGQPDCHPPGLHVHRGFPVQRAGIWDDDRTRPYRDRRCAFDHLCPPTSPRAAVPASDRLTVQHSLHATPQNSPGDGGDRTMTTEQVPVQLEKATPVTGPVPEPGLKPTRWGRPRISKFAINTALGVLGIIFLLPIIWLVDAALNPKATQALQAPALSLSNFRAALAAGAGRCHQEQPLPRRFVDDRGHCRLHAGGLRPLPPSGPV